MFYFDLNKIFYFDDYCILTKKILFTYPVDLVKEERL